MFKNFLKIALRNIKRQKAYSFINIAGLTIGLSVTLIIAFYVIDDLTFDKFHEKSDNIYRLLTIENSQGGEMIYSITSGPLVPAIKETLPQIENGARVLAIGRPFVAKGNVPPQEMNAENSVQLQGYITENSFFDIFSFNIIKGDKEKLLTDPSGIVITPSAAEALFGNEDPMGQNITLPGTQNAYVAGIVEDPPLNSHIQFQFIIPLVVENNPLWWDSWENLALSAYVLATPNSNEKELESKIIEVARANNMAEVYIPQLQPLADVHLGSSQHRYDGSNFGKNDATVVYALAIIGLMIIFVAAINFINLSTARASKRAREVGMRKVIGSNKSSLIGQFLGESVFLTILSMILSIIIIQLSLPYLTDILGKRLEVDFISSPMLFVSMLGVAILIGIISGMYPALVLSSFQPATVLKGEFSRGGIGTVIRKVLVLLQFAITISLIGGVMIIMDQIEYLKNRDMGYNRDRVLRTFAPPQSRDLLVERFEALPGVVSVGRSSGLLGANFIRYEVIPEGSTRENSQMFMQLAIDEHFFDPLEIRMAAGRNFSQDFPGDTANSLIINETAVRKAGWSDPIGKRIDLVEIDGTITSKRVVGVVKDFHFASARQEIEPLFFQLNTQNTFMIIVRLAAGEITQTVDQMASVYTEIYPNANFNSAFLDDLFDQQFNNDREFAQNIAYFSGFAIFIACLGLIGLVSYSVEQRKSEIAVRKVLGTPESKIVYLLAKDFLKWVLLANVVAWPLSYFAINLWLEGFVYRVSISIVPFFSAGVAALVIALLTMSFQSIRASRANPVDSLRSE
jgi:putative ABC transport system permease protein